MYQTLSALYVIISFSPYISPITIFMLQMQTLGYRSNLCVVTWDSKPHGVTPEDECSNKHGVAPLITTWCLPQTPESNCR